MLIHMSAQNRFTQSTRTAVHKHNQLLLAEAESLERGRVQNFLNALQFRKVVATANSPDRIVEFSGFELGGSEHLRHVALPRMFEVETQASPAIQFDIALEKVGLKQCHTAT